MSSLLALPPSFGEPRTMKTIMLSGKLRHYTDEPNDLVECVIDENNKPIRWRRVLTYLDMLKEVALMDKLEKEWRTMELKMLYGLD